MNDTPTPAPAQDAPGANDIVREDGTFDLDAYDDLLATRPEEYPEEPPPSTTGSAATHGNASGQPSTGGGSPGAQPESPPASRGGGDLPPETPEERIARKGRMYAKHYSRATSGLLSILANDPDRYPPKLFALEDDELREMGDSFSQGIREGAIPEAPWWMGLVMVAGVHLGTSVPSALNARREAKERKHRKAAPPAQPAPAPARPAHPAANEVRDADAGHVTDDTLPLCAAPNCRNRVKNKRRRFCSPSCAGKVGGKAKKPRKSKSTQLRVPDEA